MAHAASSGMLQKTFHNRSRSFALECFKYSRDETMIDSRASNEAGKNLFRLSYTCTVYSNLIASLSSTDGLVIYYP